MTSPDPHQFTRDAREANAEVWDARMGDEGNDFFNIWYVPYGLSYRRLARNKLKYAHSPGYLVHGMLRGVLGTWVLLGFPVCVMRPF